MTDTKELIDKLNDYLREIVVNNEQYEMFVEIKSFLEQQYQHEQNILDYGTDELEEKQAQADEEELVEEIRGAVARGWCAEANEHKIMDLDLAEAITEEIRKLLKGKASIRRGEIGHYVYAIQTCGTLPACNLCIDSLAELFKSYGFEVEEK